MPDDFKLPPAQRDEAIREFKSLAEKGFLDPLLVFNPEGFDFHIAYLRGEQQTVPIPEFRAYAQQFLTLLAIVLICYREFLSHTATARVCRVEEAGKDLHMALVAELSLPSATSSSGQAPSLHAVGTSFSASLKSLFPRMEPIFWDRELNTGRAKFWMKYPGSMTPIGFAQTMREPNITFGSTACIEVAYPDDEQHKRAIAVLDFIVGETASES